MHGLFAISQFQHLQNEKAANRRRVTEACSGFRIPLEFLSVSDLHNPYLALNVTSSLWITKNFKGVTMGGTAVDTLGMLPKFGPIKESFGLVSRM